MGVAYLVTMKWARTLVVAYVNIALYALCFQFQKPIEPFLVEKLSGDAGSNAKQEYGQLQSFFSLVQTFGSPLVGLLLDRLGPRNGFMLVFAGSALSYGLLSVATTMSMLYLSKVPALLQHAFLVAQTLVSVHIDEDDRAQALGMLMTAYTVGATIGPLLGGLIGATGDYYLGARLACGGSVLSMLLTLLIPPKETDTDSAKDSGANKSKDSAANKPQSVAESLKAVLTHPIVLCVLSTKLMTSVANSVAGAARPLILKNEFGMREAAMGLSMSVGMAANALSGAFLVGLMERRLGKEKVVGVCLGLMTLFHFAATVVSPDSWLLSELVKRASMSPLKEYFHPAIPYLCLSTMGSVFSFVLATVLTVVSTSAVPDECKGSLMGVEHGMFSLARVGTPTFGSWMLVTLGIEAVSGFCGSLVALVLINWCLYAGPKIKQSQQKSKKE